MAGWSEGGVQENSGTPRINVSASQRESTRWNDLLAQTYRLYGKRFWVFFRMAFLPALLAYLFGQCFRLLIRPLGADFFLDRLNHSHWYDYFLIAGFARNFVEGTFYWFLSGFLLAAVATYLLADEAEPRPLADAFTTARERSGAIFGVSLLAWTFFVICRLISFFFILRIEDGFHLRGIILEALFALPIILICGLLSRLGLAIPRLVDHPTESLRSAIGNSVRQTENWEPFFMLFVIKSAIIGFILFWLAKYGLNWLWSRGLLSDSLAPWISDLVYISIAAALETPIFISLTLLYREKMAAPEQLLPAPVE